MPDSGSLILLSERPEDNDLFHQVAERAGLAFRSCASTADFLKTYAASPNSLVVWDADNPAGGDEAHPYAHKAVKFVLMKAVPPSRTFALTDQPINLYPEDPKFPFLVKYPQHNIMRRAPAHSVAMYGRLMGQFIGMKHMELGGYIDGTPPMQSIEIQKSGQRAAAVDAVQNFLSKAQVEARLAAKIAQASDELLMNAIFDAPTDDKLIQMKHLLPRTAQFDLDEGKHVHLEAMIGEAACGICVTDYYGSVSQDKVLACLKQNYKKDDYQVRSSFPSAGLGIYNIVQSGVSLILNYVPGVKTKAMIFFPRVSSHKSFREGFQFTAVVKQ